MADYEVGDTIRVRAEFRDWAPEGTTGSLVAPTEVKVHLYNADQSVLLADQAAVNETLGIYYYDWTLPSEPGSYYIEFHGLVNGKPQLNRLKVKAKWDVS